MDLVPAPHEHLRPLVMAYAHAFSEIDDPEDVLALYAMEIAIVLLLVLICVKVAILVCARTPTRQGEIAVRGALGASRRRIVAQLFVEALMLAGVSAAIGIGLTAVGLRQIEGAMRTLVSRWPFWFSLERQTSTVIYVVGLTLCAAAIVGVTPALKATGRQVHTRLQTLSPGSPSGMQMGRLWTALIVGELRSLYGFDSPMNASDLAEVLDHHQVAGGIVGSGEQNGTTVGRYGNATADPFADVGDGS